MSARCTNSFDGGNRRPSRETDLITPDASFFEPSSLAMCALRASQRAICVQNQRAASAYLESHPVIPVQPILDLVRGRCLVSVDARHPRAPRSLAQPADQRVDGRRRPARLELDAAVWQVSHPAGDAETPGLVRRRGAEPDTLDA